MQSAAVVSGVLYWDTKTRVAHTALHIFSNPQRRYTVKIGEIYSSLFDSARCQLVCNLRMAPRIRFDREFYVLQRLLEKFSAQLSAW